MAQAYHHYIINVEFYFVLLLVAQFPIAASAIGRRERGSREGWTGRTYPLFIKLYGLGRCDVWKNSGSMISGAELKCLLR